MALPPALFNLGGGNFRSVLRRLQSLETGPVSVSLGHLTHQVRCGWRKVKTFSLVNWG